MQDRPTIHELLEAVERFLTEDLVPHLEGRKKFLARVSANVVRIVDREINLEEEQIDREWRGLDALLGSEDMPAGPAALREGIARRTGILAEKIRAGDADAGALREKVLAHLCAIIREKLSVSDPDLLERDDRAT